MPDALQPLQPGVWAVMPTPFRDQDLAVDVASIERLVDFYRRSRVTGLVALGVFGEAAQLSSWEQVDVVRTIVATSGEVRLIVGLSARGTAPAVEQAERLLEAAGGRIRAFMVLVNGPSADDLVRHLDAIATASGVGIVVQDYPAASGVRMEPAVLAGAVERCSAPVAVKAEAAPTSNAVSQLAGRLGVPVFGGLGGVGLLDELAAGAAGAMTGFSHPEGLWSAVRAYQEGGFEAARRAYAAWLPLVNFEGQQGIGLAIRKEILRRRGRIEQAAVRPPGAAFPRALSRLVDQHLIALEAGLPS